MKMTDNRSVIGGLVQSWCFEKHDLKWLATPSFTLNAIIRQLSIKFLPRSVLMANSLQNENTDVGATL